MTSDIYSKLHVAMESMNTEMIKGPLIVGN